MAMNKRPHSAPDVPMNGAYLDSISSLTSRRLPLAMNLDDNNDICSKDDVNHREQAVGDQNTTNGDVSESMNHRHEFPPPESLFKQSNSCVHEPNSADDSTCHQHLLSKQSKSDTDQTGEEDVINGPDGVCKKPSIEASSCKNDLDKSDSTSSCVPESFIIEDVNDKNTERALVEKPNTTKHKTIMENIVAEAIVSVGFESNLSKCSNLSSEDNTNPSVISCDNNAHNSTHLEIKASEKNGDASSSENEESASTTILENTTPSSTYKNYDTYLNDDDDDDGSTSSGTGLHVALGGEEGCSDDIVANEENDTVASRIDINKIHKSSSVRTRGSADTSKRRKESFEQRLRRRFTIKDEHTSEVTKRILAILIKYSLFVFNFISWVIGVAAISLGIWMRNDKTFLVTSNTEFYLDLPLMTCVGGGVTFIVAFLGCVGALRENLILLRVFFYVLTVILLGEIILATAVFIIYAVPEARDNFLRSQPEKILSSAIQSYMDDIEVKQWVDKIQSEFKCCGISHTDEGFRDWQNNQYFNCSTLNRSIYRCAVPTSCCIFEKGDRVNIMCGFDMTDKPLIEVRDYIYTRGCIIGFGEWLGNYHDLIIISCLSVIIMQFLAVLSAKLMVVRIRKQRSRWHLLQQSVSSGSGTFLASRDL